MRLYLFVAFLFAFTLNGVSQSGINKFLTPSDTLNKPRRNAVVISEVAIGGATLVALDQLWYADYPRSNFHTINDTNEWLLMDKFGHAFSAYQLGRIGANVLNWSGVSKKQQLIYGGTLGFTFLTAVEVFDGFSEEWGFSWADVGANAIGTGLYISQELLWDEQRINLKYGFHRTQYAALRPDKLGNGLAEEMLKDYNGQTYWLSANVHSFFKQSKVPKWFNVAFGYGAEGMLTGVNDSNDTNFPNQNRLRQFYFSLDLDLTRIDTNSHVLKTLFDVFSVFKLPFPTLELNSKWDLKLHAIYF
ncbi:MAG: DUF2279 domain-containing protein [Bacteroidetes bacterium MedPE-SWsnd-G2]|nr:MAG: DUF2279 domain-containing protein [Bacteroidetes bacterium MedPE-SWsnd-G2]